MRRAETGKARRFFTDTGIEIPAVTVDQMRELDRIAMEETGPNLYQMMETAGRNLALLAIQVLGVNWQKAKILVLAGGGGNGGGGICAARHLANRRLDVRLCLADPNRLGEVPEFQHRIYLSTPGKEVALSDLADASIDLILDALIGYGLKSAPQGIVAELIRWANAVNKPMLALDIPSGLDATTGDGPGEFVRARWTLTLALPKSGLLPDKTGELFLAGLGIPEGT